MLTRGKACGSSSHPSGDTAGDRVSWNTEQGRTRGRVVDRKTENSLWRAQRFTATDGAPMFVVESEKTGKRAAHKPSALLAARSRAQMP